MGSKRGIIQKENIGEDNQSKNKNAADAPQAVVVT